MEIEVAGHQAHLETSGNNAGALVLFVHGAGNNGAAWSQQLAGLDSSDYWLLAPDLPGHGRSGGELLTNIADQADWMAALVAELGRDRATVVGHSMGALVALEFAARYPNLANGIVLVGAVPRMAVNPGLLELAKANDPKSARLVASWSCRKGDESDELRRDLEAKLLRAGSGVLWNDLNACDSYSGVDEAAAKIACPVSVIAGSEDRMTPPDGGKELAQLLAGAEYHVVESAGHQVMKEQPAAVNRILREFSP